MYFCFASGSRNCVAGRAAICIHADERHLICTLDRRGADGVIGSKQVFETREAE